MFENLKNVDLENQHLYYLRVIGRKVGVKCPTALRKEDLIKEIKLKLNNEENIIKSKRGRPSLDEKKLIELEKEEREKLIIGIENSNKKDIISIFNNYKKIVLEQTNNFLDRIEEIINKM